MVVICGINKYMATAPTGMARPPRKAMPIETHRPMSVAGRMRRGKPMLIEMIRQPSTKNKGMSQRKNVVLYSCRTRREAKVAMGVTPLSAYRLK